MQTSLVNSKDKKLSPAEILIIAAHQNKKLANEYKARSKKSDGISAERLLHTIYVKEIQDPSLIRLQEGNTLYSIIPLPHRVGLVSLYNGDVEKNLANNALEVLNAAHKLGFDILVFKNDDVKAPTLDSAFSKYKNPDKKMSKKSENGETVIAIRLGKQRD